MLEFKELKLADKDLICNYLRGRSFNTYEYSFLTLYLWKKYCNVEYAFYKDCLILRKNEEKVGSYFMQPIGCPEEDLPQLIEELKEIKQKDPSFKYLFRDIEEPFLNVLENIYGPNLLYLEDTKNFDYIYETSRLINLSGDKLSKRKNQYHQFINSYDYLVKDIHNREVIEDCLRFSHNWFDLQSDKNKQLICELDGIKAVLGNLEELNALGMAVYVEGNIVGFTIGEILNEKMAVIHVEKGDTNYKGIYAFINKTFAETYLKDCLYINREEDLGIAGLRKAKLAYDPIKLEKKYIIQSIYGEAGIHEKFTVRA